MSPPSPPRRRHRHEDERQHGRTRRERGLESTPWQKDSTTPDNDIGNSTSRRRRRSASPPAAACSAAPSLPTGDRSLLMVFLAWSALLSAPGSVAHANTFSSFADYRRHFSPAPIAAATTVVSLPSSPSTVPHDFFRRPAPLHLPLFFQSSRASSSAPALTKHREMDKMRKQLKALEEAKLQMEMDRLHQRAGVLPRSSKLPSAPRKRNYEDLQCRGMYDRRILTQLERVCEDCYNLFKDPEIHGLCRSDCFSTNTFRQCLQSLLIDDDSETYLEMVEIIGKKKKR